ncbi:ankyrin repeat-containing domain protein [Alternaria rosae]|uniref:ankyrin repeat-containing domain protein n=1 Tax=Alternaria rosae TaxID=1187941 RepID=UPI001E8D48B0|nr:ankyrin repeat-containing domain protein [Alternaria rosae]KAH6882302.1 ankyrin repeat-containing domain protein [Alternaria rosae]
MAGFTNNSEDDFNTQMLAAIGSNDLATLHNMMSKREAEGPDALRRGNELSDALDTALGLARYDMAEELFKRGARWTDCTIGAVLDGARGEIEWNTKAIDVALAYGWNINEPYEHVGSALVSTVSYAETGPGYPDGDTACLKIAAHLLSKGAHVDESTQTNNNPLELACGKDDRHMAALLLAHNASLEKAPKALLNAASEGSIDIMQQLLDRGADANAHPYGTLEIIPAQREDEGWGSALHCAVNNHYTEAVSFLLEKGASKEYRNMVGLTALDLARKLGHEDIVRLLE